VVQKIEAGVDSRPADGCRPQVLADAFQHFPLFLFPACFAVQRPPPQVLIGQLLRFTGGLGPTDKWLGVAMIHLTRLNSAPIVVNCDLIEHVDITPDTVIVMTTGQVFRVRETADEVIAQIVEFRRRIAEPLIRDGEEAGPAPAEDEPDHPSEG
jgi:flagellar protein FlbD